MSLIDIWEKEDEDPYTLKPISKKEIKKAEIELGVILPDSYKQLILKQNGGYITYDSYPTKRPTSWADDHIQIDYIFGIGYEEGIMDSDMLSKEWNLPKDLILFNGDGHTWIAFDYRNKIENPSIIYVDSEENTTFKLAKNFDDFLSKLYLSADVMVDEFTKSWEWTMEEAENIFNGSDEMLIHEIVISLQSHNDMDWVVSQLKTLVTHKSTLVRETAVSVVGSILGNFHDDKEWIIKQLEDFSKHENDMIRQQTADAIVNQVLNGLEDELNPRYNQIIELLINDSNESVRELATMAREEMNM